MFKIEKLHKNNTLLGANDNRVHESLDRDISKIVWKENREEKIAWAFTKNVRVSLGYRNRKEFLNDFFLC